MGLLDGVGSVGVLHAHPDDETLASGALIAWLADRGVRCHLLTATRGERGEVVPGSSTAAEGSPELVAVRETELAGAARALGLTSVSYLGSAPARATGADPRRYEDSGMRWVRPGLAGPAENAGRDTLTAADPDEVLADLIAWAGSVRPELIISYEADGGYGHPDHVRLHELTRTLSARTQIPMAELVPTPSPDSEWYDLESWLPTVTAALSCHRTQVRVDGAEVVHVGGQREPILTSVGLRAVQLT